MKNQQLLLDVPIFSRIGALPILFCMATMMMFVFPSKHFSPWFQLDQGVLLVGILIYLSVWGAMRLVRSFHLERQGKSLEQQVQMRRIGRYFLFRKNLSITLLLLMLSIIFPAENSFMISLILGISFLAYTRMTMPKDSQIDAWVSQRMNSHEQEGLETLHFDQDELVADNLSVKGIGISKNAITYVRYGSDKKARFSMLGFTTVYFSEDLLLVYYKVLDLVRDEIILEKTEEYFYQEIVSLETERTEWRTGVGGKNFTINPLKMVVAATMFFISIFNRENTWVRTLNMVTSGGTAFSLYVSNNSKKEQHPKEYEDQLDNALKALRKMLREKKTVNKEK
ncbi:hypothetical protein JJB07_09525 [Tumebacillus sp. ITR2]|uniref:DUF304 domain-containing protein n=1 Tax=Tumebacillus amylolyticus TaxID=2801339 RepID=A0ABS1J9E8_9BACL|nr:hypothetical protein [Tumebacillus amylolyticus]MBL0386892.1 hypothetical protein [Tumebacillus amylolyticus]